MKCPLCGMSEFLTLVSSVIEEFKGEKSFVATMFVLPRPEVELSDRVQTIVVISSIITFLGMLVAAIKPVAGGLTVVVSVFLIIYAMIENRQDYKAAIAEWKEDIKKIGSFYYCLRDKIVINPETGLFAEQDKFETLLKGGS